MKQIRSAACGGAKDAESASTSVPCKLNNAEAKRTHRVGAARRVPQTEMNLSEAKSIT